MKTQNIQSSNPEKTLDLLWSRVRQRGDLPGFSKAVSAIIGAMRGEDDREFSMTKTVLSDPALTQRVLRLANSAMYSAFGQGINTVSKAVIVLGTESIGHLALGLKLIDGLSAASTGSANARTEMEKAVLAGHIARQVASSATTRDAEEAVVCSMLHSLGRMMVAFYLSDRWALVQARSRQNGITEEQAAHDILGLGLDEIGRVIAKQWGLPAALVDSLQDVTPQALEGMRDEPLGHSEWLAAVSTMSTRCAGVLCDEEASAEVELEAIADDYAQVLGLDASEMLSAVETAQQAVEEEAGPAKAGDNGASPARALRAGKPADAAAMLQRGVADVRDAFGTASAGQLMSMALETAYQGLGLSRAIVFLRNQEEGKYAARMCFGEGTQELLPRLVFGDAYQPDVFHAALANDKMIFVEDAQAPAFISKLPRWWRGALPTTRSFLVLPLTVSRQPVGFIYGDWDWPLPTTKIESAEAAPLDELRNLVVRSLEHRRHADPGWGKSMR
jgi:HD-like signal output (HDOD) protein